MKNPKQKKGQKNKQTKKKLDEPMVTNEAKNIYNSTPPRGNEKIMELLREFT